MDTPPRVTGLETKNRKKEKEREKKRERERERFLLESELQF